MVVIAIVVISTSPRMIVHRLSNLIVRYVIVFLTLCQCQCQYQFTHSEKLPKDFEKLLKSYKLIPAKRNFVPKSALYLVDGKDTIMVSDGDPHTPDMTLEEVNSGMFWRGIYKWFGFEHQSSKFLQDGDVGSWDNLAMDDDNADPPQFKYYWLPLNNAFSQDMIKAMTDACEANESVGK